ncbi:MAG: 50S ribosomal protein L22 [Rhodobacteraceae bacterium]|nr:50S ribosomal protein L22 [Paracoccaceae bacterium]
MPRLKLQNNEAIAIRRMLRVSPQKLNLVAAMIRGKRIDKALDILSFSQKRIAREVSKALQSAISNAQNNDGLDIDLLVVKQAYVGKNMTMKRIRPRARGRADRIHKPFSQLTIVVQEVEE